MPCASQASSLTVKLVVYGCLTGVAPPEELGTMDAETASRSRL